MKEFPKININSNTLYMRADQRFDEFADFSSANYAVKSGIDLLIHGDSQFLSHTCSIRITGVLRQAA